MTWPWENQLAESNESANNRELIAYLEGLFVTTDPREFTAESIDTCISQINGVIIWIDRSLDEIQYNKEKLYKNLSDARIEFILAITEFHEKGQTRKYYRCLENGHRYLKKTLGYW